MKLRTLQGYIFMRGVGYVGMDQRSGGYPYITDNAMYAHVWVHPADALNYHKMFQKEGWKLYKLFTEVDEHEIEECDLDDG